MKAIILAAGYGTRLKEIAKDLPKALLKLGNKTILDRLMENLKKTDIKNIVIVTNNKFYQNFNDWKNKNNLNITIVNDGTNTNEERLGALGDLRLAIKTLNIKEDVLVLGSDNILNFEIKDMLDEFRKEKSIMVALAKLNNKEELKKMGVVSINKKKDIILFEEKPLEPKSNYASTAVYIYPKEKLNLIEAYLKGKNNPEGPGNLLQYYYNKERIHCFISKEPWFDVGSIEVYDKVKNGI
ncbi:MAG: nucleotidyltransferase family protein [Candidatus Nanoarchaeia archaeon]|nr:nucleotidyltransferase family protein [Candidatus Nanoarchaeia archaeon]